MRWGISGTKAAAASTAETITFNESDLPGGSQVVWFGVEMTGTARDYDAIDTVTVKGGGGEDIFRLNELQLAAYLGYWTKKAGPGATATRFSLPFFYGSPDGRPVGFPAGKSARIEVAIDNTPSATGILRVGYLLDETPKAWYMKLYSVDCNIAASQVGRYQITEDGFLRGFILPDTADITTVRVYVRGQMVLELSGPLWLEASELATGTTVTTNRFFETPPILIVPGETSIEIDAGSGWGGVTEDISVLIAKLQPGVALLEGWRPIMAA